MDRVEGSAGFVRKRCVLRPKLLWPTSRKWGGAHTVVVFFSGSRDPEVTFRGHVMFQVLIKRRFSRRRRDFSIESDCLGLPEAESVELRHFPRWRNPPFSKMANANQRWFSRGVFSRRNRDFSIVSGCGGATEYAFVDAHTSTGTGSA